MEYLLERKVKVKTETEYESLYSWCLNEFDDSNNKIGHDLVPFNWRFWFTGTSLKVVTSLSLQRDIDTDKSKASASKRIIGKFYSGVCFDGKNISDEVVFSVLGTARTIKEFIVSIREVKDESEEVCLFTVIPSYVSEDADFRKVIEDDYAGFDVYVHAEKFNELVTLVESRSLSSVGLSVKNVDGVYAEWTPTIKTRAAKFLAPGTVFERGSQTDFQCPTVSKVDEFEINFNTQITLDLKQNLPSLDFSKAFDREFENNFPTEELNTNQADFSSATVDLQPLVQAIKSLKVVIFLIFAALIFLLLK